MSEVPLSLFHPRVVSDHPDPAARAPIAEGRCSLLGMPLNGVTETQALDILDQRISRGQGTWVLTPNLDILRQYYLDPTVRPLFHASQGGADLLLADGMPLIWASRLARRPLPERVPGSTLVLSLAKRAAQKSWRIFLLGGAPGAASRSAEVLQERYPGLQIAGTACPPMGFENDPAQVAALREQLAESSPDIVYVALGFPKQEFVTRQLRPALPNATFIGVGISLSFIAGEVARAPRWVQSAGLEWLHRLAQEPRRLARRYLVLDAPFALFHLFPRAIAARWNVPGRSEPLAEHTSDQAAFAPARKPGGPRNPRDDSEGSLDEGHHSRRRPGLAPEPPDQGDQQAPAPGVRQADDYVSDRLPA